MAKRDTYNYTLKDGKKHVYKGVTKSPSARVTQHAASGKEFTHMVVDGPAKTRGSALAHEADALATYRRHHRGQNPKYNKKLNGR